MGLKDVLLRASPQGRMRNCPVLSLLASQTLLTSPLSASA